MASHNASRVELRSNDSNEKKLFAFLDSRNLLSAFHTSKIGVVICDRRLQYQALNQSLAEMHNLPIAAHLNRPIPDILGPLAEKVLPFWESVLSTGTPLSNVRICGKPAKRSSFGCWLQSFFPLTDDRGRINHVGCFATEFP